MSESATGSSGPLTPQRVRAWQILVLALIAFAATTWIGLMLWPDLTTMSVEEIRRRGPSLANVMAAFLIDGCLLVALLVPAWQAGYTPRSILRPVPSRWLTWWAMRVGVALLLVATGTVHLLSLFLVDLYPDPLAQWMFVAAHPTIFEAGVLTSAIALVELAVVGVFVEELIFRGLILPSWESRWGPRWAVGLSSLVWALFHPLDILGALVFGVVVAVAYLRTRMLLVPFLIHATYNATGYLNALAYEFLPGGSPFASPEAFRAHWWVGVIGLLLGAPWLWHLLRSGSVPQPSDRAAGEGGAIAREAPRVDLPAARP